MRPRSQTKQSAAFNALLEAQTRDPAAARAFAAESARIAAADQATGTADNTDDTHPHRPRQEHGQ